MNINIHLIKEWIASNRPQSREKLALKTGINAFTLDRILRGERAVRKPELLALSVATGIPKKNLLAE